MGAPISEETKSEVVKPIKKAPVKDIKTSAENEAVKAVNKKSSKKTISEPVLDENDSSGNFSDSDSDIGSELGSPRSSWRMTAPDFDDDGVSDNRDVFADDYSESVPMEGIEYY